MTDIIEKVARAIETAPRERKVTFEEIKYKDGKNQITHQIVEFIQTPQSQAKAAIIALADGKLDSMALLAAIGAVSEPTKNMPYGYINGEQLIFNKKLAEGIRIYLTNLTKEPS